MKFHKKIKLFNLKRLKEFKSNSKKILCHGHYDIIHPGHLRFLESASHKGSELFIALYDDKFYDKNDKINHYNVNERAKNLASLIFVDYVIIIHPDQLHQLIDSINFSYFILGEEFKKDRNNEVKLALDFAKKNKTKILFHAGERFGFDEVFKSSQRDLRRKRWNKFSKVLSDKKIDLKKSINKINKIKKTSITVLGDIIVDSYISCLPLGMSEEAPLVVVKELEEKKFLGGAGIVAKHINLMGNKPRLISVVGDDENYDFVRMELKNSKIKSSLFKDKSRPTTLKTRYIVEKQKIFRASKLNEKKIIDDIEKKVIDQLTKIRKKEILVVSDFVYGVITDNVLNVIKNLKKDKEIIVLGDLQCSSQIGDVSKFTNFDIICATEKEARIAMHDYDSGIERVANLLLLKTKAKNLILKLGSEGFIIYRLIQKNSLERTHFPALEPNPVDLAGAGDTLLSALAISLSANLDLITCSAIASCASAVAVQKLGNTPIKLIDISKFILDGE